MFDVADVQTSTVRSKSGRRPPRRRALRYRGGEDGASAVVLRSEDWRAEPHQDPALETMEQLTDASRQVSATAQQIAAAAGTLADLAGNLEATAATTRERH